MHNFQETLNALLTSSLEPKATLYIFFGFCNLFLFLIIELNIDPNNRNPSELFLLRFRKKYINQWANTIISILHIPLILLLPKYFSYPNICSAFCVSVILNVLLYSFIFVSYRLRIADFRYLVFVLF